MNYVVDEVKRSRKEDVSILTHPRFLDAKRASLHIEETPSLIQSIVYLDERN